MRWELVISADWTYINIKRRVTVAGNIDYLITGHEKVEWKSFVKEYLQSR